jgi:hypothetical protein
MKVPEQLVKDYSPGSEVYDKLWMDITETADLFNEPGRFTALIGFEWTSVPKGFNLHRNVILCDNGEKARQVVPLTTQPPIGTTDPLDLYQWLENYEKNTGGQALAISHNGNLSNGWLFPTELKKPDMLQREYAREALKNGMLLEDKLGTNPYKFGMVGATDTHTGLTTAEEDNYFGKSTTVEPSATRASHPFVKSKLGAIEGYELAAAGG